MFCLSTNLLIGMGLIGWGVSILAQKFFKIEIPLIPLFLIFMGILLIFNQFDYSYKCTRTPEGYSQTSELSFGSKKEIIDDLD